MKNSVPTRRRRLRFGLRSLLLFVTIICVWLGWQVNAARRQKDIVTAMEKLDANVQYDYQMIGRSKSATGQFTPHWLAPYLGVHFLHSVNLVEIDGPATPEQIRSILTRLRYLRKLEVLMIRDCMLKDEDLQLLSEATTIGLLNLEGNRIEGQGVKYLRNLAIDGIILDRNPLTDDGLKSIVQMENLTWLNLHYTSISDSCIPILVNAEYLKKLNIEGTQMSSAGIRRLHELRPDLTIAPLPP